MTINDAINEMHIQEINDRRQAYIVRSQKEKNYLRQHADNLAQLQSWLIDYKQITGKE